MAMRRNAGSLVAVGLLVAVCCAVLHIRQESSFVAPQPPSTSSYSSSQSVLAQGLNIDGAARSADVSMKAQVGGKPNRINLLYLATLLGTLVIGLIFTLGYGGYSGPGSSEIV
eukprot:TRINITY_DN1898_c0_g1_i9.p1 TRINITY_DN1898_c0_g1~~TRINITY_DN1898_c0_g1_i9.p1  ORF type:complete len:113 (-),score=31.27 TRINITY_DN1898_c0_g1_i9:177-515(-)